MNNWLRKSVEQLQAYVPGEQPKTDGLIKLNTNENPYPPSPAVADALRTFDPARLRLYPDPSCAALRQRLAALHDCAEDQVFIGNGSDEVLRLAMRAFTQTGGAAAAFSPSYSLYPVLAAMEEVAFHTVDLADDFDWTEPPEHLPATLFLLANPNAPTGRLYDRAQVKTFCGRFPGVVLLDGAYIDFAASADDIALAKTHPRVLACRTLSKSFSLAGLRMGYAIGHDDLIGAMNKLKDSYNINALSQTLALAALGDMDYMRNNAARIVATRTRVEQQLAARGWQVIPSAANFLFAKPPANEGVTTEQYYNYLRKKNILVRHFPAPQTCDYLRISIGTEKDMDILLDNLNDPDIVLKIETNAL